MKDLDNPWDNMDWLERESILWTNTTEELYNNFIERIIKNEWKSTKTERK